MKPTHSHILTAVADALLPALSEPPVLHDEAELQDLLVAGLAVERDGVTEGRILNDGDCLMLDVSAVPRPVAMPTSVHFHGAARDRHGDAYDVRCWFRLVSDVPWPDGRRVATYEVEAR